MELCPGYSRRQLIDYINDLKRGRKSLLPGVIEKLTGTYCQVKWDFSDTKELIKAVVSFGLDYNLIKASLQKDRSLVSVRQKCLKVRGVLRLKDDIT